jgi:hypothetical protein
VDAARYANGAEVQKCVNLALDIPTGDSRQLNQKKAKAKLAQAFKF